MSEYDSFSIKFWTDEEEELLLIIITTFTE